MGEAALVELAIASLDHRGEGVAKLKTGALRLANALPGERVIARLDNRSATLVDILEASPERIAPICRHFGDCGGCAAQHMSASLYAEWKRSIVTRALAEARIKADFGPLVDAHGEGRRRTVFHARFNAGGAVGYMRARAHRVVAIEDCPVLAPSMSNAISAARVLAAVLAGAGKPLDLSATASLGGLDVDIRGAGELDFSVRRRLIEAAGELDLARLSNHGEILLERRPPEILIGPAAVRTAARRLSSGDRRGRARARRPRDGSDRGRACR
jgi:23S rRNA (uracil1939-C5)-methyltransferase